MAPISSGKQFYHKQGVMTLAVKGLESVTVVAYLPIPARGYIRFVQGAYDPDSASLLRDPDVVCIWIVEQSFDV